MGGLTEPHRHTSGAENAEGRCKLRMRPSCPMRWSPESYGGHARTAP